MGRRSDHTRAELTELILAEGRAVMAQGGFARFSAREVAKRIGYSVGTLHNVFGGFDRLVTAINTRTFALWADELGEALQRSGEDRIAALVHGYFAFARTHSNLWSAIYDHRLPDGVALSDDDVAERGRLTEIVLSEIARAIGRAPDEALRPLTRSLIATVHGHCVFTLAGSFALMGESAPEEAALARVREILAAARG